MQAKERGIKTGKRGDLFDNMDNAAVVGADANIIFGFDSCVMTKKVAFAGENGFGGGSPR